MPRLILPAACALLAAVLMLSPFAVATAHAQGGPPASLVTVDPVVVQPLSQTFPVIGRIVAKQSGVVAAAISGPVDSVPVNVGDRVAAGDVLAVIDPERMALEAELARAALAEAEALLRSVTANVARAQQEFDRVEGLRGSAAFSQARTEDAEQELFARRAAVAVAEANVLRARNNLALAELNEDRSEVRAPYPGIVSLRHAQPGAFMQIGGPVVTLIDVDNLEIEADVPVDRVVSLSPGVGVDVAFESGAAARASVRAVVLEDNPLTRTRAVRFTLADVDPAKDLALNQSLTLAIPVGTPRQVVTVHKDGINLTADGAGVFVDQDGAAQPRVVELGLAVGNRFEVLSGLEPGDLVIIRGNERLRPGQPVRSEEAS